MSTVEASALVAPNFDIQTYKCSRLPQQSPHPNKFKHYNADFDMDNEEPATNPPPPTSITAADVPVYHICPCTDV